MHFGIFEFVHSKNKNKEFWSSESSESILEVFWKYPVITPGAAEGGERFFLGIFRPDPSNCSDFKFVLIQILFLVELLSCLIPLTFCALYLELLGLFLPLMELLHPILPNLELLPPEIL